MKSSKKSFEINAPSVNGFSGPLHALQIVSWAVYAYLNISFHSVYGLHQHMIFIVFNVIHLTLSIIMFYSVYLTTKANVVDEYVKERGFPTARMSLTDFKIKYEDPIKNKQLFWCKYCKWYVDKSSKHCRACNRCTTHFDHHCRWLNNCISKQNYGSFVVAICSTQSMLLFEIVLGILMLTKHIDIRSHLLSNVSNSTVIFTLLALHVMIASCLALPLTQLILFHIYLNTKHISTYDWVVDQELRKIEKEERKLKKKKQNTVTVSAENDKVMHKYIKRELKRQLPGDDEDMGNNHPNMKIGTVSTTGTEAEKAGLSSKEDIKNNNTNVDAQSASTCSIYICQNVTKKRNSIHVFDLFKITNQDRQQQYSQNDQNLDPHNIMMDHP
eukprot:1061707_1